MWLLAALAVVALPIGVGFAAVQLTGSDDTVNTADAGGATSPSTVTTSSTPPKKWTPAPKYPAPGELTLGMTVLEKKCFGSAGCNITYRIEPMAAASRIASEVPAGKAVTVIYEVLGGDSGPQINRFTVTSSQVNYDDQEFISTASEDVQLTARVTQILP